MRYRVGGVISRNTRPIGYPSVFGLKILKIETLGRCAAMEVMDARRTDFTCTCVQL